MNDMPKDEEIAEPKPRRFRFKLSITGWVVVAAMVAGGLNLLRDSDNDALDALDVASSDGATWPPEKSQGDRWGAY